MQRPHRWLGSGPKVDRGGMAGQAAGGPGDGATAGGSGGGAASVRDDEFSFWLFRGPLDRIESISRAVLEMA